MIHAKASSAVGIASHIQTPHHANRRRIVWAAVVAIGGVSVSCLLADLVFQREQQLAQVQFHLDASLRVGAIQQTVADRLAIVDMLAAYFAGSEDVTRDEFRVFTQRMLERHPGIHALAWAPRVPAGKREAFEQSVRDNDTADYRITERNAKREFVAAAAREEYFPVLYREPIPPSYPLFGFDLRSILAFRTAIDLAAISHSTTAVLSAPLDEHDTRVDQLYLIQSASEGSARIDGRGRKTEGVIVGVFDLGQILDDGLQYFRPSGIHIALFDSTPSEHATPIYTRCLRIDDSDKESSSRVPPSEPNAVHYSGQIIVAGQTWTVDCTPTATYLAQLRTWGPMRILAAGLSGTILVVGYLLLLIGRTAKVEQLVAEQLAEMQTISDAALDALIIMDPDGNIAHWNAAGERMFGYAGEEVLGRKVHDVIIPEFHREQAKRGMRAYFANGRGPIVGKVVEIEALRKDGAVFPVEISVAPLQLHGRWWAVAVVRDITYRKRATEALHKEQRLLRDLLNLHENDRRLVAYEIHDGLAQQLAGALYKLESVVHLREDDPAAAAAMIDDTLRLLRECSAETRRLIGGLRPPILDEWGVVAAIEYLIDEQRQRGGMAIEFSHDVRFDRLAAPLESSIFRIVQESLTNARHHSQSDKVHVRLTQANDRIHIQVQDWGIGFDPSSVHGAHFGLNGIRERARLLGGSATIESALSKGTCISVDLPLVLPAVNGASNGNGLGDEGLAS
jgi:PAS domain S-box-containing protein